MGLQDGAALPSAPLFPSQAHPQWPSVPEAQQGSDSFLPGLYTHTRAGMFMILLLEAANEVHLVKVALLSRSCQFEMVFCSNPAHMNAT